MFVLHPWQTRTQAVGNHSCVDKFHGRQWCHLESAVRVATRRGRVVNLRVGLLFVMCEDLQLLCFYPIVSIETR